MDVSKESDVPKVLFMFQSPQWGVILKTTYITTNDVRKGFSPHNGERVLKDTVL